MRYISKRIWHGMENVVRNARERDGGGETRVCTVAVSGGPAGG